MQKGQAAIELLIILAASMIALIAIYSYSSTSMAELNKQKLVDQAQTSVYTLTDSANDIYRQGVGAKKQVFYTVPSGVDQTKSGIENNTFVLNVLGSDVYGKPKVCLLGQMPTSQGGHWVWLTAQAQCVFIGTENIAVDKTSSYVTIGQSETEQDTITITNNGSTAATIFLEETWTHTDVNLVVSSTSFSLTAAASQAVTLTYGSNATAAGNFPGMLSIGARFATGDENILLPLNAEAIALQTDLLIFPATYNSTLRENDVNTSDLNVCNDASSTLTNISFSDSGQIADWIAPITAMPTLAAGSCTITTFTITVPDSQAYGTYTGIITASDDTINTDSTEITVDVPGMATDFELDWSPASFAAAGRRLWEWTLSNNGSDLITIDRMTVYWWNDLDGANLDQINLNNVDVWSAGNASSGQELDITDFDIPATTTYSGRLEFDQKVNDNSEDFQITFTFTDGSTYTSTVYAP